MSPAGGTATYVYGVSCGRRPRIDGAPEGLRGMRALRAIEAADKLWIVAADAPLERYSSEVIDAGLRDIDWVSDCAVRHERVVEHFAKRGGFVPMRLFTLFSDDERASAHMRRVRRAVERSAARIEGCAEWGVRAHLDVQRAARASRAGSARAASSGADFLRRKRAVRDAAASAERDARDAVERLHDAVAAHARDAVRRPPVRGAAGTSLVLDAVFLVERREARALRTLVARAARDLAPRGLVVSLTGPWPAYHFVGSRS
jgi:hypothetical protein